MTNDQQSVFPVSLLLGGRPCLVLGGGKVATRKVKLLLEAGADVTLVSPALSVELQALAGENAFRWVSRRFEPADLDGMCLVYAATDRRATNRAALNLCRQRGILCCPVDDAWADGDFLTPATVRDGDLTIAINTAGHACRRSRLVKQSIERHIGFINKAALLVIGTSHEQLDIAAREALQRLGSRLDTGGRMICRVWGMHEFYLLNTCNRLELHAVGVSDPECIALLLSILGFDHLPADGYYVKTGWDAFEHACALCAGLFSQMLCEYHIVAQIKDALGSAMQQGWAGGMMQEWTDAVLHVSAEMRSHFDAPHGEREIEDTALDYLQENGPRTTNGTRLLLLGTGRIGTSVLRKVMDRFPFESIEWFWHRTPPAIPVNATTPVTLYPLTDLRDRLPGAGVIITALAADRPVLSATDLQCPGGNDTPLVVLDLGLPRNVGRVTPDRLPSSVRLIDLDALKAWDRNDTANAERLQAKCRELVLEHKAYYEKLVTSFQGRDPLQ